MKPVRLPALLLGIALAGAVFVVNAQAAQKALIAHLRIGASAGQVGLNAGVDEVAPTGPEAIVAAEKGSFLLLDGVNARVLRINADGTVIEAAKDTRLAYAQDMVRRQNTVYALGTRPFELGQDSGAGQLIKEATESTPVSAERLFESNGAVFETTTPGAEEQTPPGVSWLLTADGYGESEYRIVRDAGAAITAIEVRGAAGLPPRRLSLPDAAGYVGSVALLTVDAARRAYLRVEVLQQNPRQARAKVWVVRYSAADVIEAGFDVPDQQMAMVPNRYLAVSDQGTLVFLQPTRQGINLLRVPAMSTPAFLQAYKKSLGSAPRPATAGETAYETAPGTMDRSRTQIMAEAENFRTVIWTLNEKNYGKGLESACVPTNKQYWRRPSRLDGKQGSQIVGVPYNWGGYMSVSQFNARIAGNAIAGNICTCRGNSSCVIASAAGVDCSGFVSQVWGVSRKTTISLTTISRELKSYQDLRQGDILNKRNSHVRLFAAFSPSGNGNIRAYESSVGCGGVCVREFTTKQMEGYLPRQAPISKATQ